MTTEIFTVIALPRAWVAGVGPHVSLFVAPRLVPDAAEGATLGDFACFPDWAGALMHPDTTIVLSNQHGQLPAQASLTVADASLWAAVFPAATSVAGPAAPDFSGRQWRSFDAAAVQEIGRALTMQATLISPTDPPLPSALPTTRHMNRVMPMQPSHDPKPTREELERLRAPRPYRRGEDDRDQILRDLNTDIRREFPDEAALTARFDTMLAGSLTAQEKAVAAASGFDRGLLQLHLARRFYERPESVGAYAEQPSVAPTPLGPREQEFHERLAMVGDHPELMRMLGLVVDLEVDDLAGLSQSTVLSATITVPTLPADACRSPRVQVRAARDGALLTVPASDQWQDGALALGGPTFTVLDLEADGTALKAERYLWSLPRLARIEANGAPGSAAPPALRASGFTVARRQRAIDTQQRMSRQTALGASIDLGTGVGGLAPLSAEEVTRGFRVEVWDDTAKRWASLHRRRTVLEIKGHEPVKIPETLGYLQGTTAHETPGVPDPPVHVHEALFGWDGWSLSAPRPGATIRNEPASGDDESGYDEQPYRPGGFDEPDADPRHVPSHVLGASHTVLPGSLPVLRFGRDYAFRAWQVDLAGNSRVQPGRPARDLRSALARVLADRVLGADAERRAGRIGGGSFGPVATALRTAAVSTISTARSATATTPPTGTATALRTLLPDPVADEVNRRIATRRLGVGVRADLTAQHAAPSRRAMVTAAIHDAVTRAPRMPLATPLASAELPRYRDLLVDHVGRAGDLAPAVVGRSLATVTPLRPYLRWDPAPAPAIVPTGAYSEGESLRVFVIRSGVTQDSATGEITVTAPADYLASVQATHPEAAGVFAAAARRHLAPPKTSQLQAEQHGAFDRIVTGPDGPRRALAAALRENGAFSDLDIADLDTPLGRIPVEPPPRIVAQPGVDPADVLSLPLAHPGDPVPGGQFVANPGTRIPLPYLPDPIVRGISVQFPEAGLDRALTAPCEFEGFTVDFAVSDRGWPEVSTLSLALEGADRLGATADAASLVFRLPPGDLQSFRLSSALHRARLEHLGVWRTLDPAIREDRIVREAVADGLLWAFTPAEDVLLVHAVPRPLERPDATALTPIRPLGATSCVLFGALDVHGPSTAQVTMRAEWQDVSDDPAVDDDPAAGTVAGTRRTPASAVAFTTPIRPSEDIAILTAEDATVPIPMLGTLSLHRAVHEFGDTRHRRVRYHAVASTRFREYFPPELLEGEPGTEAGSVAGRAVELSVPSTARPAPPVIHSVLPLFRWSHSDPNAPASGDASELAGEGRLAEEPEHPMAIRHRRRAGVRIYLERPWYTSGEGELLGVLFALGAKDDLPGPPPASGDGPDLLGSGYPYVSKWGQDPIWTGNTMPLRPMTLIDVEELMPFLGFDEHGPARPVTAQVTLPLPATKDVPATDVVILGYRPRFNPDRGLWYVDVAVDPRGAFWPFVRLAVARFQPDSVPGAHLSDPVQADFVQLPPERTTTVSRTDATHVRVVVSGTASSGTSGAPSRPVPVPGADLNRYLVARLQRADAAVPGDLGWRNERIVELVRAGSGEVAAQWAWAADIDSPEAIPLTTPTDRPATWRVVVEEWERFEGDPDGDPNSGEPGRWEQRLVFADEVYL
ncbi:hypothetical protein [Microbacterium lushaniae]|uniref:Uncharacterized protein n=1 Tax=Microbacterium lushaniae TaxID=2614639 RepID=A0A5J6L4J8_9MICO|nr:hypothetical protein [Microbacterium lushaniae]QEW03478.1 hypothetical protein F6J85_10440 [Microbacterium lushaniae]